MSCNAYRGRCSAVFVRYCLGVGVGFALLLAALATQAASGQSSWATIEDDRGISLIPVLACRTQSALRRITASNPENRRVFVGLSFKQGECTRLSAYTAFILSERKAKALRIRTTDRGRLWVSQITRVTGIAEIALAGQLAPELSEALPTSDLTQDEQENVDARLAESETSRRYDRSARVGPRVGGRRWKKGNSGMKSCRCLNGRYIKTQRSCNAACGVHESIGETGPSDDGKCYFRGEEMDCQRAGERFSDGQASSY